MLPINQITVFCHSSIKIQGSKTIYVDPFKIPENFNDADIIFCTHSHYDHFSEADIRKVMKESTKIVIVEDSLIPVMQIVKDRENILLVKPEEQGKIENVVFSTTYAYNSHHPKSNNWVGYQIQLDNTNFYIAGDTDFVEEVEDIQCDIAFLPIGGTYTMDYQEAALMANTIKASIIIPIHYASIVGTKEDAQKFKELVNKKVEILIK